MTRPAWNFAHAKAGGQQLGSGEITGHKVK